MKTARQIMDERISSLGLGDRLEKLTGQLVEFFELNTEERKKLLWMDKDISILHEVSIYISRGFNRVTVTYRPYGAYSRIIGEEDREYLYNLSDNDIFTRIVKDFTDLINSLPYLTVTHFDNN